MNAIFSILINSLCLLLIVACSSGGSSSDGNSDTAGGNNDAADKDTQARPFQLKVPNTYNAAVATPLIIALHGYTSNADEIVAYFRLLDAADRHGFLLAYPNGTINESRSGDRYWNATDACCAYEPDPANDLDYLVSVMDEVERDYNVDPKRIFFVGHSNGGFMSHRMACEQSSRIAAIVSLAGAQWQDASRCPAAQAVSVLQVHGDLDNAIFFGGGNMLGNFYPSAHQTVATWADKNGCMGGLVDAPMNIDVDTVIAGDETRVQRYSGCPSHGEVELWTIFGAGHVPSFDDSWADLMWGFLVSHPKP